MDQPALPEIGNQSNARHADTGLNAMLARPGSVCLLLAALTFAVFWPVGKCDFINYVDPQYVTSNPQVQAGLTLNGIVWAFATVLSGHWHPLTWLSHMLDVQLFGLNPAGPHVVNALLHAANTLLLFLLLRQLTSALWPSAFVAALFAVHPLHVESVAWISERKDVLSTFFGLLTLLLYARYAQNKSRVESRESRPGTPTPALDPRPWTFDYCLAVLFFALGLMSKPMLVTLPFVLLLLDYWPLNRVRGAKCQVSGQGAIPRPDCATQTSRFSLPWPLVWEKWPLFLLSAASCVVTFRAQKMSGAVLNLTNLPIAARIENAFISYARYLGKLFWPANLALPYPHPERWPIGYVLFAVVLVSVLCAAAVVWRRKLPYLFVGWFWFLGTLIPVIGLIQVGGQSIANRYTYVPLIGLFIALTWSVRAALARWRLPPLAIGATAALTLGASAAQTVGQLRYWQNSGTLFRHVIEVSADNYMAQDLLGYYLMAQGRVDEAAEHFQDALRINPNDLKALDNLGSYSLNHGRPEAAIEYFQRALRYDPGFLHAWIGMGSARERLGQFAEAIHCYENARRLAPAFPQPLNHLGNAFYSQKQYADAIRCYEDSLKLAPDDPRVLNNLGGALFKQSRGPEAIRSFEAALRLKPDYAEAHNNLAAALQQAGQDEEAVQHYTAGLRLNPENADAHLDLGRLLAKLGRREEAVAQFKDALRLKPDEADAKQALQTLDVQTRP
jgi:tetratricopeptide (TPR) repeat protein